jgi:hypothetical protein
VIFNEVEENDGATRKGHHSGHTRIKKTSRELATSGRSSPRSCVAWLIQLAEIHHDEILFTTVRGVDIDHGRKQPTAAVIQLNP